MNQADEFLKERQNNHNKDITARIHEYCKDPQTGEVRKVGNFSGLPEASGEACKNGNASAKTSGGWFSFHGRATRKEWWIKTIVLQIPTVAFFAVLGMAKAERIGNSAYMTWLLILLPVLVISAICLWAVNVRRLHDRGMSGWWMALLVGLNAILWLGTIVQVVMLGCLDGQPFTNKYGPDPKGRNRRQ